MIEAFQVPFPFFTSSKRLLLFTVNELVGNFPPVDLSYLLRCL